MKDYRKSFKLTYIDNEKYNVINVQVNEVKAMLLSLLGKIRREL